MASQNEPIALSWAVGFSHVRSLQNAVGNCIFFVSGHTGVIFDIDRNSQTLLQGHLNPITSVAVSRDKRWIATSDSGSDALIIIWDVTTGTAARVIRDISSHYAADVDDVRGDTISMDFSADSMVLCVLSCFEQFNDGTTRQFVSLWPWSVRSADGNRPCAVSRVPQEAGEQNLLKFNPIDQRDLISCGTQPNSVCFWSWATEGETDSAANVDDNPSNQQQHTLTSYQPSRLSNLTKSVGTLTGACFLPFTSKAVVSSSSGHLMLFDVPLSELRIGNGRDAIKSLRSVVADFFLSLSLPEHHFSPRFPPRFLQLPLPLSPPLTYTQTTDSSNPPSLRSIPSWIRSSYWVAPMEPCDSTISNFALSLGLKIFAVDQSLRCRLPIHPKISRQSHHLAGMANSLDQMTPPLQINPQ